MKELLGLLSDLDSRFDGAPTVLYLFGGAAAVLAYGAKRATVDIDGRAEDAAATGLLLQWAGAHTDLARKHGVYFQNANLTLMPIADPDWKERCVPVLGGRFKNLRVMALGKEDLILSKLGRYNDRDRADIGFLAQGVDAKRLTRLYREARQYYVGRLQTLDLTFNIVLAEHFGASRPLNF